MLENELETYNACKSCLPHKTQSIDLVWKGVTQWWAYWNASDQSQANSWSEPETIKLQPVLGSHHRKELLFVCEAVKPWNERGGGGCYLMDQTLGLMWSMADADGSRLVLSETSLCVT